MAFIPVHPGLQPFPLRSCSPLRRPRVTHGRPADPRCAAGESSGRVRGGLRLLERPVVFPALVQAAEMAWRTVWGAMMAELAPSDAHGTYARPRSPFLGRLAAAGPARDLVLYVGPECPWCHRVLLAMALLDLRALQVHWARAGRGGLWELECPQRLGPALAKTVRDVYLAKEPAFRGRATVPLLVQEDGRVLCNESAELLRELPRVFGVEQGRKVGGVVVCLQPQEGNKWGVDGKELDTLCDLIYEKVNNGVYKCGFSRNQAAYDKAVSELFEALDSLESRLAKSRFLLSNEVLTEADVRLFPTIYRFDTVYNPLFKANLKSIQSDYPAISGWARDIYSLPGVAETCDLERTKQSYFSRLFPLNPGGIVPAGPIVDFTQPHNRDNLQVAGPSVPSTASAN